MISDLCWTFILCNPFSLANQPNLLSVSEILREGYSFGSLVVVQSLTCVWLFAIPWTAACQASLSFTVCWSLLKLMSISRWWCHPTISSSVAPFSSCPLSFPASVSFPVRQLFTSGGHCILALASASVLPMNIQGWYPLRLTGLIPLKYKELSRVFSSTTTWKYQFVGAQFSLWSSSNICTWLLKNHHFDYIDLCQQRDICTF